MDIQLLKCKNDMFKLKKRPILRGFKYNLKEIKIQILSCSASPSPVPSRPQYRQDRGRANRWWQRWECQTGGEVNQHSGSIAEQKSTHLCFQMKSPAVELIKSGLQNTLNMGANEQWTWSSLHTGCEAEAGETADITNRRGSSEPQAPNRGAEVCPMERHRMKALLTHLLWDKSKGHP